MNHPRLARFRALAPPAAALLVMLTACGAEAPQQDATEQKYEASWESIKQHEVPEWLMDAKFGIYAHWGPYSVPAFATEWYGKEMNSPGDRRGVFDHHMKKYGGPAKFGYHKFIPMFKAEKFDPAQWADLIAKSGARYAGIAVVHHDGFGMWDSDVNRWNAGKMGPKRDIYGELVTELRKKPGMKTIATFHHIRTFNWFLPRDEKYIERAKEENWAILDPEYKDFYWNEYTSTQEEFMAVWNAKVREVMDKYQPDVVWFDGGKFQEDGAVATVTELLAYYLNKGMEWGKEVEILNKLPTTMQWNFPRGVGVLTYEQGRDRPPAEDLPWIDDMSISETAWGYKTDISYRDPSRVIDGLVDRVARGGGLILSLAPMADGTIPQGQQDILLAMGGWFDVNGEAIFGTRPWKIHAEGDTEKLITKGEHPKWEFKNTTAEDIRFTTKGNDLYAIVLDWPAGGKLTIKTLGEGTKISGGGVDSVEMLGAGPVEWTRDADGLTIGLPSEKPCDYAYSFKIKVKGTLDR